MPAITHPFGLLCESAQRAAIMRLNWKPVFQHPPCSRAATVLPRETTTGCEETHVTASRSRDPPAEAAGSHTSGCKQTGIHLCCVLPAAHLPSPTHFLRSPDTGAKGISLGFICELGSANPIVLNFSFPLLKFTLLLLHVLCSVRAGLWLGHGRSPRGMDWLQ